MSQKIAVIGKSHAVAFLDAISNWREQVNFSGQCTDPRYTKVFHGWSAFGTGCRFFKLEPFNTYTTFSDLHVCLFGGTDYYGPLAYFDNDLLRTTAVLDKIIDQVRDFDVIISIIGGGDYHKFGLVKHAPDFDFFPYEKPVAGQPVDLVYIDKIITTHLVHTVIAPLVCMKKVMPEKKFFHVLMPPPLQCPERSPVFEGLQEAFERVGFIPSQIRKKIYERYIFITQKYLNQWGVILVDPYYDEACKDGFLKLEFAEGVVHCNAAYGKLIANRLSKLLSK